MVAILLSAIFMDWMLRTLRSNRWLSALAIAALALRILVPAGFMPVFTGDGLTITICSGSGMETLTVDANGRPVKPQAPDGKAEKPCSMSGLGMAGLTALPLSVLLATLAYLILAGLKPSCLFRASTRARIRPPLRAPPLDFATR